MNTPLGGKLIDRVASPAIARRLLAQSAPRIVIHPEKATEVRNIAHGAYSPLKGFLTKPDFTSVLKRLRLADGTLWPIPIILDIDQATVTILTGQKKVFLVEQGKKKPLAIMDVEQIYPFDKDLFCRMVFKTNDVTLPGVKKTNAKSDYLLGGNITLVEDSRKLFPRYNLTPLQVRAFFKKMGWKKIVGFHTRNVPHRGHEHIQQEGLRQTDGIFMNPLVGWKKEGDFTNEVVVKSYVYLARHVFPPGKALVGILPYSPYYGGPREALLTALIRKNFGCTHFIIGRDHTGVGDFYKPEDYERILKKYRNDIGITILHFKRAFYCHGCKTTSLENVCPHSDGQRVHPSGTLVRKTLSAGKTPPAEMMRPAIVELLLKEKKLFV